MKLQYDYPKNKDSREITAYTNNYGRSDNTDALGQEFTFDLVSNPLDINMKDLQLELGGKVMFYNDDANNNRTSTNDSVDSTAETLVFSGIITDEKKSGINKYSYTAYDYAFYLNKSEVLFQCNDIDGTTALRQLCEKCNIKLGSVPVIYTKIKKVYQGEVISDVIKDVLKQATEETGNKYRFEVRGDALYIEDYKDLILDVQVTKIIGDYSHTRTLADMKNKVVIISSSEKHEQVIAETADDEHINIFGLLQHIEKIDDKDASKANEIARKKLIDLNKIGETFNFKLLGDDTVRSGRILHFDNDLLDLKGYFLIKNCTHAYGQNHTMTLALNKVTVK